MLFRTHLWDSLFDIEPKKTTPLSTNSFDLYDMRYTARYSESRNILYIPDCDHWGGINDQFGITDSALYSALYPDRGRLDVLRSLYASAHKLRFHFHAETTLRARAEQLNVSIIKLPMCYSNIRLYPHQPYLCSFMKPVVKTVKGYGCCKQFCIDIKHHMQQRNAAMDNSITLEKYTKKLGIPSKASNFYYFHMRNQWHTPCLPIEWNSTAYWDFFHNVSVPFIKVSDDQKKISDYEIFAACQNRNTNIELKQEGRPFSGLKRLLWKLINIYQTKLAF